MGFDHVVANMFFLPLGHYIGAPGLGIALGDELLGRRLRFGREVLLDVQLAESLADAFTAALVVASAPGKLPRRLLAELRILEGAVPTIHAPWVPGLLLKRAADAAPSDVPAKEITKITTMLTNQGIPTQGETK